MILTIMKIEQPLSHRPFAMLTRDAQYAEKGKYDSDQNSETTQFRSHSMHLRCRRKIFMPAGPGISLNRHLPIGRNISGSLCDLCASNERREWAVKKTAFEL